LIAIGTAQRRHAICAVARVRHGNSARTFSTPQGDSMKWSQPAFEDLRFGFEITMYISNR
jgi:coenzyme PQQ precursor peptide PqqA